MYEFINVQWDADLTDATDLTDFFTFGESVYLWEHLKKIKINQSHQSNQRPNTPNTP